MDQQVNAAVKVGRPVHQCGGKGLQRGDVLGIGGVQAVQGGEKVLV